MQRSLPLKRPAHPLNSPASSVNLQKARILALRPDTNSKTSTSLAQRQAAQDDAFLREVDDALREDEVLGALRRYGRPVGAIVIAGLLAFAGYLFWDNHRSSQQAERAEQFTLALDKVESGSLAEGDKQLAGLATDGHGGSRAAAALMRAGIALEQKRPGDAVKLFAEVSADTSAPQPFRDLATIREVATNFDTLKPDVIVERMKPLAVPGNPWFGSAGEMLGIAYLKQGRGDLAGPLFAAIAHDGQAPDSLRQRSRQLAGMLGVDAIEDVNKAAGLDPSGNPAGAEPATSAGAPAAKP